MQGIFKEEWSSPPLCLVASSPPLPSEWSLPRPEVADPSDIEGCNVMRGVGIGCRTNPRRLEPMHFDSYSDAIGVSNSSVNGCVLHATVKSNGIVESLHEKLVLAA